MKTLLLSACLLIGGVSEAAETKSDTIIINVGANKKVVVYGETKADLKDLEKIDLNKALKEMNKNLEEMPVKTRKMVVRDYDGGYKLDSIESFNLSKWQKFYKKVNFNLIVGTGFIDGFEPSTNGAISKVAREYMNENYGRINGTYNLGFSLIHSSNFRLNNRFRFSIKKGLQYEHILAIRLPTLSIYGLNKQNDSLFGIWNQVIFRGESNENYQISSINRNIGMLTFQLKQTITLLDKKGRESFQMGVGIYTGVLPINRSILKRAGQENTIIMKGFANPQLGVNLSLGYKIYHLFIQSAIFNNKSNSGLTTSGLRIGR